MINCISEKTLEDLREKVVLVGGGGFRGMLVGGGAEKQDASLLGGKRGNSEHLFCWGKLRVNFSKSGNKKMSDLLPGTLKCQDEKKQSDRRKLL